MKEQITVQGRSKIFNIVFVLINLLGLSFMAMGYHVNFEEQKVMFLTIGLISMMLSIGGLIIFKGKLMMASVARVIVGGLFIVSGLVKANDPIGFAYKLEEYFEDGALAYRVKELFGAPGFSLEFFIDYALILSVLICIAEIVLGVLTIIGGKIKLVSYLMMAMMVFFTFLTWHTANCDPDKKFIDRDTYAMTDPIAGIKLDEAPNNEEITIVSRTNKILVVDELKKPQCVDDCGCFGDALKGSVGRSLTPQESLWKDIVLLYLVFWIFLAQWIIKPNSGRQNLVYFGSSMLVITFFSWVFGWYFPIFFGAASIISALWILRSGGKLFGNHWMSALVVAIMCVLMVSYVLRHVPMKDYRPYAIGENLVDRMNDGIEGQFENLLVYSNKTSGEKRELNSASEEYMNSKIWEDQEWEYDTIIVKTIITPKNPSIMDYNPVINIEDIGKEENALLFMQEAMDSLMTTQYKIFSLEYESYMMTPVEEYDTVSFPATEYRVEDTLMAVDPSISDISVKMATVTADKIVILVSRKLDEANWSNIDRVKDVYTACKEAGIPMMMICNANSREEINQFRNENELPVPSFSMDGIELKIISRANPAIMILEKGTVTGKYGFRSVPSKEKFIKNHLK